MRKILMLFAFIYLTVGLMASPTSTNPIKIKSDKILIGRDGKSYDEVGAIAAYWTSITHYYYAGTDAGGKASAISEVMDAYGPTVPLPCDFGDRDLNNTVANYVSGKITGIIGGIVCGAYAAVCLNDYWACMRWETAATAGFCYVDLLGCTSNHGCHPIAL